MSKNGSYLTRDAILAISDLKYEDVDIPEWGGSVRVRELTAMERNKLGADFAKGGAQAIPPDFYPKIAATVIVNQNGKSVFTEGDTTRLGEKSFAAIQRVVDTALRISGMTQEGVEEAGKGSETPQITDSPSP